MDDSDKTLRDTNLRFHGLCQKAREWLLEQLTAKGCRSRIENHLVVTAINDPETGVSAEARVSISPKMRSWSRMADGIKIKVERDRNSINYVRETEKWEEFPWDKIITAHLEELSKRLRSRNEYRRETMEREELQRLAQQEVPLPVDQDSIHGEHLRGFERRRNSDGTYHVDVRRHNFTADEARAIRDLVLAAENRTRPIPLSIPEQKHEDTETAKPSPATPPQEEA